MMYFYMYLQPTVPESCLSGTIVKYMICLFYLSDCFQTKACCIPFRINFSDSSSRTSPPIVFSNPFFVFSEVPKNNPLLSKKSFYRIHYKCSSSFIFCTCSKDVCVSSAISSKDRSLFFNK